MTFSLGDKHDKAYECQCGHFGRHEHLNVDKQTWTCTRCLDALLVHMDDLDGRRFIVKRYPAHQVPPDQTLVYCNNLVLASGCLNVSNTVVGRKKDTDWFFSIKGYGPATVPRGQYVNVHLSDWPV